MKDNTFIKEKEYNHTKIDQWRQFSAIVNSYYQNTPFEKYEVEGANIQEHLNFYIENIIEKEDDLENPVHICIMAYFLYCSLCFVNPIMIEFEKFANIVASHIKEYVEKQYGNFPDKTIEKFTPIKIQGKLEAYTDRIGKNIRGENDALRDSLKIAHFSCYLYCLDRHGDPQEMPL